MVATQDGYEGPSLSITAIRPKMGAGIDEAFRALRKAWIMPDGQPLPDGKEVWRHARELALGFYYKWKYPAPEAWLAARKEWCAICRAILGNNRLGWDSELHVKQAVEAGYYPDVKDSLDRWHAIRDTFKPVTIPVWIDEGAIQAAAKWMHKGPGIVWVEHSWWGRRLAQVTSRPYYGAEGKDATGRTIPEFGEPGCGEGAVIASRKANGEGRNLQGWSRNLVVCPDSNGDVAEQLIGRTHRDGQAADEVSFELFMSCRENATDFLRSISDSECTEDMIGQAQKLQHLALADIDIPDPQTLR